jgi:protein-S-isoprenylcysteine O-methyltransferase Ste14
MTANHLYKGYSFAFVLLRAALLIRAAHTASPLAYVFLMSEVLALSASVFATVKGVVCRESVRVPWLYLVPLLFVTRGVEPTSFVLIFVLVSCVQVFQRLELGLKLTVGNPCFSGVVSSGAYRFVRHPLAALEAFMAFSLVLSFPTTYNVLVAVGAFCAAIAAALLEESFLIGFSEYREYALRVRRRFIPGLV